MQLYELKSSHEQFKEKRLSPCKRICSVVFLTALLTLTCCLRPVKSEMDFMRGVFSLSYYCTVSSQGEFTVMSTLRKTGNCQKYLPFVNNFFVEPHRQKTFGNGF